MDAELIRAPGVEPRDRIVLVLRQRGVLSRAEIARLTGLAKSTVSETVADLFDDDIVVTTAIRRGSGSGRPALGITLNPKAGVYVGIDFGFRHVRAVVADVSHTILATSELLLEIDYSLEEGLGATEEAVESCLADAGCVDSSVLGIGAAIPGPVNPASGTIIGTSMVPRWSGADVRQALTDRFGRETLVDNESNCAALAELLWGAARGLQSFVYCKLHSGVGGAVVVDEQVIRGMAGVAGEFGHISMDPDGPLCRCGGRGCLETYVGIPAVVAQLHPRFDKPIGVREMIDAAVEGDLSCRRILADTGDHVGRALATVSNVLAPEAIVVGGALAEAAELLLDPLEAALNAHSIIGRNSSAAVPRTSVRRGELGRNASALGAVALVVRHLGTAQF